MQPRHSIDKLIKLVNYISNKRLGELNVTAARFCVPKKVVSSDVAACVSHVAPMWLS
jgi:hypothetical protein